eukprot:GHVH01003955.1.p1 GENE.GHVH01003955.1~~GHVH01003955.1.p1  ORF type:complete len:435 (+),score=59.55 GHVH01003955.1:111-1415(+)
MKLFHELGNDILSAANYIVNNATGPVKKSVDEANRGLVTYCLHGTKMKIYGDVLIRCPHLIDNEVTLFNTTVADFLSAPSTPNIIGDLEKCSGTICNHSWRIRLLLERGDERTGGMRAWFEFNDAAKMIKFEKWKFVNAVQFYIVSGDVEPFIPVDWNGLVEYLNVEQKGNQEPATLFIDQHNDILSGGLPKPKSTSFIDQHNDILSGWLPKPKSTSFIDQNNDVLSGGLPKPKSTSFIDQNNDVLSGGLPKPKPKSTSFIDQNNDVLSSWLPKPKSTSFIDQNNQDVVTIRHDPLRPFSYDQESRFQSSSIQSAYHYLTIDECADGLDDVYEHWVIENGKRKNLKELLTDLESSNSVILGSLLPKLRSQLSFDVSLDSNQTKLKKSYMKAVKLFHPDKHSSGQIEDQYRASRIYNILQEAWITNVAGGNLMDL